MPAPAARTKRGIEAADGANGFELVRGRWRHVPGQGAQVQGYLLSELVDIDGLGALLKAA